MAASFCGTNTATISTGTSATFSHTLSAGSNRLVVCLFGWGPVADNDLTSVTYGGVSMTATGSQYDSNATAGARARMFYLTEASLPSNGAQTVDPTWSLSEAGLDVSCYVFCFQDCPSPVFTASGSSGTSNAYYPATVTATGLDANSLLLTMSAHSDVSTGALSCDIGTADTELNTAGELRSRSSYLLDTGASGDKSAVWSVASESTSTKAASLILGIEYTAASSSLSGWGVVT